VQKIVSFLPQLPEIKMHNKQGKKKVVAVKEFSLTHKINVTGEEVLSDPEAVRH
jgi:hypothetical protein